MKHQALKIYTAIVVSILTMAACGSSKSVLNTNDDDVYYSKKQADQGTTYVPEVDVQELIKKNPPQYNKQNQEPTYRNDESNNNINPNAALQYPSYRAARDAEQQQEAESQNNFLTTTSWAGQEDEAEEAARLRMQYGGVYNDYSTTNYFSSGWDNGWNTWNTPFWGRPALNIGWNNFTGWGVGIGWNSGWGWGGGWNNWGWNNPWAWGGGWGYDPFWGWNNPWAWGGGWNNPWCGNGWNNWGWRNRCNNNWGHNGFVERTQAPQQRVRQMPGSGLPAASPQRTQLPNGQVQQASGNDAQNSRVAVPRSTNEAQLINKNGQQIYVAPEQYRTPPPRSYSTYEKSEKQAEATRQATPRPTYATPQTPPASYQGSNNQSGTPAPSNQRESRMPRSYQYTPNQQPANNNNSTQEQQPVYRRPATPRSYEAPQQPSYSPSPSRGSSTPSMGGGGSRGGSTGGGGGSTPRPRSR